MAVLSSEEISSAAPARTFGKRWKQLKGKRGSFNCSKLEWFFGGKLKKPLAWISFWNNFWTFCLFTRRCQIQRLLWQRKHRDTRGEGGRLGKVCQILACCLLLHVQAAFKFQFARSPQGHNYFCLCLSSCMDSVYVLETYPQSFTWIFQQCKRYQKTFLRSGLFLQSSFLFWPLMHVSAQ